MQFKSFMETLKGKQHKIDKNKNGKIDAQDFKLLQKEESEDDLQEAEQRLARADYKVGASGRKSHKQIVFHDAEPKDEEEDDEEDDKDMKEAKMTDAEMAKRERIVKGMKKNLADFESKYGSRGKDVMYATATKMAMKEDAEQIKEKEMDKSKKDDKSPPWDATPSDRKSKPAKPGGYMVRARALARKGMQQAMKEQFGIDISDEQADEIFEDVDFDLLDEDQLDELSNKTLDSYKAKAYKDYQKQVKDTGRGDVGHGRVIGIARAQQKRSANAYAQKRAEFLQKQSMKSEEVELEEGMTSMYHKIMSKRAGAKADDAFDAGDEEGFKKHVDKSEYHRVKAGGKPTKINTNPHKKFLTYKEEVEELDEKSEQARKNKMMKNTMDASRGARFKAQSGTWTPDPEPQHKTAQAHNKAVGRAIRQMSNESAPVAPSLMKHRISVTVSDPDHSMVSKRDEKVQKTVIVTHSDNKEGAQKVGEKFYKKKGYRVHDSHHAGMVNEEISFDQEGNLVAEKLSFSDFMDKLNEQLLEYETKDGVYKHKGTYGGSYVEPDDYDDAGDKKKPAAEKRGRGRPAGAKSGARKITGTSKLFK